MGASYTIKAGIAAMQKQATYLLFMVADQPELSKESVRRLVKASGVLDTGSDCETEKRSTRDIVTLLSWNSGESLHVP